MIEETGLNVFFILKQNLHLKYFFCIDSSLYFFLLGLLGKENTIREGEKS